MPEQRRHKGQPSLVPLTHDERHWNSTGWTILKWCVAVFAVFGFLAGYLAPEPVMVAGTEMTGATKVAVITIGGAATGFLFGLIWLLIFKSLGAAGRR